MSAEQDLLLLRPVCSTWGDQSPDSPQCRHPPPYECLPAGPTCCRAGRDLWVPWTLFGAHTYLSKRYMWGMTEG